MNNQGKNLKIIITIDAEGDNIWSWKNGDIIHTENCMYIPRFQNLCEKYGFKPVCLTDYEMVRDSRYVKYIKSLADDNRCEIGMHLHAYNNPPFYKLNVAYKDNFPFITEYPEEIIEEKVATITRELEARFERKIQSHRSGRWVSNDLYFKILKKYGYKVDCSVTPLMDWRETKGATEGSKGNDYRSYPRKPYYILDGLMEVPLTTRTIRKSFIDNPSGIKDYARIIKHNLLGRTICLSPNGKNLCDLQYLIRKEVADSSSDYLMFLLHSSELMPAGSRNFKTSDDIENLYSHLEILFKQLSLVGEGSTLSELTSWEIIL